MKFLLCLLLVVITLSAYTQNTKEKQEALKKISKELKTKKALFPNRNPVYIVDETIYTSLKNIDTSEIVSITVIMPKEAVKKYGNKAKSGALIIQKKQYPREPDYYIDTPQPGPTPPPDNEPVVYNAETEVDSLPKFDSIKPFIEKNLRYPPSAEEDGVQGIVTISFIVDVNGLIYDIKLDEKSGMKDGRLVDEALRLIKKSTGKWRPAIKKGIPVRFRTKQKVTFILPE
jgi:hypothetical protein